MQTTKLYVRIDPSDAELSTLTAISNVLKASNLDTAAQGRVLRYLVDRVYAPSRAELSQPMPPIVLQANGAGTP